MNDEHKYQTLPDKAKAAKAALIKSVHQAAESEPHRAESTKPNTAIEALFRLACGDSRTEACRRTGLHPKTLNNLIERHSDSLKMIRESSALKAAAVGEKGLELLGKKFQQLDDDPDALAKIDPAKIAVATGIMIDKAAGLEGRATVVIEHRSAPSKEEYAEALRKAKGRVVDVEPARQDYHRDGKEQIHENQ